MLFDSFHLISAMKHLEAQKGNSCIAHTAPPVHLGICLTSAAQQQIERGCNTSSPESPNRCTSPFDFGKRLGCLCTYCSAFPGASLCTEQAGRFPSEECTWSLCPLWRQGPDGWLVLQPTRHAGQPYSKRKRGHGTRQLSSSFDAQLKLAFSCTTALEPACGSA